MSPMKVSSWSVNPAWTSSLRNRQTDKQTNYSAAEPLAGATSPGYNFGRVEFYPRMGWPPNPFPLTTLRGLTLPGCNLSNGEKPQPPSRYTKLSPQEWPFLLPQCSRLARGLIKNDHPSLYTDNAPKHMPLFLFVYPMTDWRGAAPTIDVSCLFGTLARGQRLTRCNGGEKPCRRKTTESRYCGIGSCQSVSRLDEQTYV